VSDDRRCQLDVAAYALGALDAEEARDFTRHLKDCAVCRDELAAFEQIVDALPLGVARLEAPRRLRRSVLAEVRRSAAEREASRRPERSRPRLLGLLTNGVQRPAFAAVALVIVALAVAGVTALSGGGPAARIYRASVGHAVVRVTGQHAELVADKLPQPPPGRVYEVWLVRAGRNTPQPTAALFSPTTQGVGDADIPGSVRGVRRIMVTEERAGGSQTPTTQPVIVAALTRS
jgi:anti-sigma factor RsiW